MRKIEILWSGGWDSTFMLLKLAREYDVIQPYYILFNRSNQEYEINAIHNVLNKIAGHKEITCHILPVIYVRKEDIVEPLWLRLCWEKYKDKPYSIAPQCLTLAAFAMSHKGIAVGQERYYETPGHMTRLMYEKGHMKFTKDGVGYFDKKCCNKDVYEIVGNAVYPVSLFSELMMKEKSDEWGFQDIMKHSWFCYYPIDGKPCGLCGPCRIKVRQHMDFLFSKESLNNAFVFNYLKKNNLKSEEGFDLSSIFSAYVFNKYQSIQIPMDVSFNNVYSNLYGYYKEFEKLLKNPMPCYSEI